MPRPRGCSATGETGCPDALERLEELAADPYPRVRLEAVRAASFFTVPEAVEVPLITAEHPSDYYLDYTRGETMRALEPYVKKALAEGHRSRSPARRGARFFLSKIDTADLLKMKQNRERAPGDPLPQRHSRGGPAAGADGSGRLS